MAGSKSSGFSVSISAKDDGFTATLDRLNKRLAVLSAPAERFNKSVDKFADVSGVNKLSEGMQSLGSRSLDVFRSLDRIAPALGAITGAASLAGMSVLVQRWAQLGQQTYLTGQRLGVPTDRLTALRGAARLAGASAQDLDAGLGSLDEKLRGATFRGDAGAIQTFNALGVSFGVAGQKARTADEAFGDVADGVKRLYDTQGRGAALRAVQGLGLESLFPMLIKGREGIQALSAEAARHGVVISPEAAQKASDLAKSFTGLEESAEGLGNKLAEKLSGPVKTLNDGLSKWLDNNRDLMASNFEGWINRIGDGLQKIHDIGFAAAAFGTPLTNPEIAAYNKAHPDAPLPFDLDIDPVKTQAWSIWNPGSWLKGHHEPGSSPFDQGPAQTITAPNAGTAAYANMTASAAFWRGKGFDAATTAAILSSESAESGFNPDAPGGGTYQYQGDRWTALTAKYGPHPTREQQDQFAYDELTTGNYQSTLAAMNMQRTAAGKASVFTSGFEVPKYTNQRAAERAAGASQFEGVAGSVNVVVELKGAPPGTTAKATASGRATVAPPRVETAMPGIH